MLSQVGDYLYDAGAFLKSFIKHLETVELSGGTPCAYCKHPWPHVDPHVHARTFCSMLLVSSLRRVVGHRQSV